MTEQLHDDQQSHQGQAQVDKVVTDGQHRLLEVRCGAGAFHQFGRTAEEGIAAGGGHQRDHLALFGDRAGIGDFALFLVYRQ